MTRREPTDGQRADQYAEELQGRGGPVDAWWMDEEKMKVRWLENLIISKSNRFESDDPKEILESVSESKDGIEEGHVRRALDRLEAKGIQ